MRGGSVEKREAVWGASHGFAKAWEKGKPYGQQKLAGKGLCFTQGPVKNAHNGEEWLRWKQQTPKRSGGCRSSQWPLWRRKPGWRGCTTRGAGLRLHVLVRTAHCHSKLLSWLLPAKHGREFKPFWQAEGWWKATPPHVCWAVLPHGRELLLTMSWLNFPSSFILIP